MEPKKTESPAEIPATPFEPEISPGHSPEIPSDEPDEMDPIEIPDEEPVPDTVPKENPGEV